MKLGITIPKEDIQDVHYLPKGGLILSLNNHKPGSAYRAMIDSIKKGGDKDAKDMNLFFNFMMTKRRNSLSCEIRKLKKEKEIAKYYTDFDGTITIKKDPDAPKIKLTSITNKKDDTIRTFTIQELKDPF